MSKIRKKKINKLIDETINLINSYRLSKEEMIKFIGEILTRIGYSIYYGYERKDLVPPSQELDPVTIDQLWLKDPTAGSSIMKLGCDVYEVLLSRNK